MNRRRAQGILLDLDNTLYDYSAAHQPALQKTLSWLAQTIGKSEDDVSYAYAHARRHVNTTLHGLASSHSRLLYFQGVCENFGFAPYDFARQAEDLYWSVFFHHMVLRPGVLEFLDAVRPIPIALITDLTTRIQFEKISYLGLAKSLSAIVTSEEAGHEKPHLKIFEIAAAKLDLPFDDLCMIGDSWERDIEGALKYGMQCYWFKEQNEQRDAASNGKETSLTQSNSSVTVFSNFSTLKDLFAVRV